MDYKLVKSIIKGAFTFIPGVNYILEKKRKKSIHSGSNAEFVYSLWLSVLVYLSENNIKPNLIKLGEVGNGGSLGIAFCAILTGTKEYYDFEYKRNINIHKQIELLDKILLLFKDKTAIKSFNQINIKVKNHDFPSDLVLSYRKQVLLSEKLKQDLHNALLGSGLIRIVKQWEASPSLALNFVFSRATMEHVLKPNGIYQAIYRHLLPSSYTMHDIEFHSHGLTKRLDGHMNISTFWWPIVFGRRTFFLNRWDMDEHIRAIKQCGFSIKYLNEVIVSDVQETDEVLYGGVVLAKK